MRGRSYRQDDAYSTMRMRPHQDDNQESSLPDWVWPQQASDGKIRGAVVSCRVEYHHQAGRFGASEIGLIV